MSPIGWPGSAPITYMAQSKPERGYALSAGEAAKPVRAGTIDLDPEVSTAEAFQIIALSCLDHAAANSRAVREGETEGVHQMRVGLRRLRAAISVFKEYCRARRPKKLKPNSDGSQTSWDRRAISMC